MSHLGPNLRRLRRAAGFTQEQLSRTAKIPRATLASMERGASNPGLDSVMAVAVGLGVSIDELVNPPAEHRFFKVTATDTRTYLDDNERFCSRTLSPIASRGVQIQQVEMAPGCRSVGRPHPMGAQEFFFTYAGTATLMVGGEEVTAETASLVQFPGHLPHVYENRSKSRRCQAYSVIILAMG